MITVVLLNLGAIIIAAVMPNEFLKWHSYLLYGLQFMTMIPFLLKRASKVEYAFLPTFFVLVYYLVNTTLGSYLVPRDFGWDNQFTIVALDIRNYQIITPFLMCVHLILFVLSVESLQRLARVQQTTLSRAEVSSPAAALAKGALLMGAFFAVSYNEVWSAFSFQLAIIILHLTDPSMRSRLWRWGVCVAYLLMLAAFSYENKREIAMVLFLIVFLETYYSHAPLKFKPVNLVAYAMVASVFFGLVLAASILRGYGDLEATTLFTAVTYIPQYMTSDVFIDGITENLELNYNYGVTITAIDHGIRTLIDYQYGGSLIKVLFLPIPRDALPFKPVSMMQMFTQVYAPEWWSQEGSMPVNFSADMFLNFHYLGLVPFALVWLWINRLFVKFHAVESIGFVAWSCLFLSITVLMFARGSGLELWLLYYLVAAPVFLIYRLAKNALHTELPGKARWFV